MFGIVSYSFIHLNHILRSLNAVEHVLLLLLSLHAVTTPGKTRDLPLFFFYLRPSRMGKEIFK